MTKLDTIALASAKAKGKRPIFFEDPAAERNLAIVMAVAQELSVMRMRMDTIERLLEEAKLVGRSKIDGYKPDDAAAEERMRWQDEYVARILRYVHQERLALEEAFAERDVEEMASDFGRG